MAETAAHAVLATERVRPDGSPFRPGDDASEDGHLPNRDRTSRLRGYDKRRLGLASRRHPAPGDRQDDGRLLRAIEECPVPSLCGEQPGGLRRAMMNARRPVRAYSRVSFKAPGPYACPVSAESSLA